MNEQQETHASFNEMENTTGPMVAVRRCRVLGVHEFPAGDYSPVASTPVFILGVTVDGEDDFPMVIGTELLPMTPHEYFQASGNRKGYDIPVMEYEITVRRLNPPLEYPTNGYMPEPEAEG